MIQKTKIFKKARALFTLGLLSLSLGLFALPQCSSDGGGGGGGGGGNGPGDEPVYDYVCNNGEAAVGTSATENTQRCTSCDSEYSLAENSCVADACTSAPVGTDFHDGGGTEAYPFIICTPEQLVKIGEGLTAHYRLGKRIDVGDIDDWTPLGNSDTAMFTGSLDGDGYEVSNLRVVSVSVSVSGTSSAAGLFGYTGADANIRNVALSIASFTIDDATTATPISAGGLVGVNKGAIANSFVIGGTASIVVTANNSRVISVGGLVGVNDDASATITNSYAKVEIKAVAPTANAGGLVGVNKGTRATITNSYATGSSIATMYSTEALSFANAGGLVGLNDGTIANSYATGVLSIALYMGGPGSGSLNAGGLVGRSSSGTISNSFACAGATTFRAGSAYVEARGNTPDTKKNAGWLVGLNEGMISETNYFTTGLGGDSTLSDTVLASKAVGNDPPCTTCVLHDLDSLMRLTSTVGWEANSWDFGNASQLPRLRYINAPLGSCGVDTNPACGNEISGQDDL